MARPCSANWRLRDEVLRVVGVAGAGIAGGLGVGENGTGAEDFAGGVAGFAEELIGNFAVFDPGDEGEDSCGGFGDVED